MTSNTHAVFLFHSSNHAFRAEKVLGKAGIECKLIPVPRHLSSDCGVCARIDREQVGPATDIIASSKVETAGIHEI